MLDYVEAFHNLCPLLFFSFRDFLLTLFLFPLGCFFKKYMSVLDIG